MKKRELIYLMEGGGVERRRVGIGGESYLGTERK